MSRQLNHAKEHEVFVSLEKKLLNTPLPIVEGVAPSCQWLPTGPWKTVIDFFRQHYPQVDVETWTQRMADGKVVDEAGRLINLDTAYRVGACIYYYRRPENEKAIPFVE